MTEQEILERQVEALEKLLQLKEAIIAEQEARIQKLEIEKINVQPFFPQQPMFPQPPISIPSVWIHDPCTDGKHHEYPNPWFATTPPPCNKCGKQSASNPGWTVTSHNNAQIADDTIEAIDGNNLTFLDHIRKAK